MQVSVPNSVHPVIQTGMDIEQMRDWIVRPALKRISQVIPWSLAAENLVIGTAIHESKLRWVDQLAAGPGPAYGLWQMERPTYLDLWDSYIPRIAGLSAVLLDLAGFDALAVPPVTEMHGNLFFAAAMCRVLYRRVPDALPGESDARSMAEYWKRHYNTRLGKGTVEQSLPAFQIACEGSR